MTIDGYFSEHAFIDKKGMPVSLLISEPKEPAFLLRFEHVRTSLRRIQLREGLSWTLLALATGVLMLTIADYVFELPRSARAIGLGALGMVVMAVLIGRVVAPLRWWTRPRTAVEIERRFPELGQRIRTVVQYAGLSQERVQLEGITPSLVDALSAETELRVEPLDLDTIVSARRLRLLAALAALPALAIVFAAGRSEEWRIALERTFLSDRPYTTLDVTPGSLIVDEGQSVAIAVALRGRMPREVVLQTRTEGQSARGWTSDPLKEKARGVRETRLEKVTHPLRYRIVAGSTKTPEYEIRVRYPLAIRSFNVDLNPPPYTRVKPSTVKGGDLQAIAGSSARFRIVFDASPAAASLVLTEPAASTSDKEAPKPQRIPLKDEGSAFTAELALKKGLVYQIDATTSDGRRVCRGIVTRSRSASDQLTPA